MSVIRFFYNLAFPLVLVVMLPALIWKMIRRGKYRHRFGQRFGLYSARVRDQLQNSRRTWVHAVSVGEVLIAMKLIRRLRERDPGRCFVLSTTTSTGFALASEQRADWLEPIYNPLDFFLFTRAALRLIRPVQLILVEAEVWPNLVAQAHGAGVPCILVNARLSPRSEQRFRTFRAITAPVFNQLDAIGVPDPEDIGRWQSLGVRQEKLHVTGSIKFDEQPAATTSQHFLPLLRQLGVREGDPVLLGASTHFHEEEALGRVLLELKKTDPRWFLLSVPRHTERTSEVLADLTALGLTVQLRTNLTDSATPRAERPDVLLVNTTGELRAWTPCADIVFVGKSLLAKGGQNPSEAIESGRPVVFGPHMRNFEVLTRDLLRHGGAIQITTANDLPTLLARLMANPAERESLVANGRAVLARHLGATDRTCDLVTGLLRASAAS